MAIKETVRQYLPRSILVGLQHAKANFLVWRFKNRIVKHNYGGHLLTVHLQDPMSEQWYNHDCDRPKEIELLAKSRLREGSTVFDIGSHQSVVAIMLAKEVGDLGRVIAVEPNPFNIDVANLNLASNNVKNVTQVHAMIASSSGVGQVSFQLNANPVDGKFGLRGRKVASVTIDELSKKFGSPDVIYVDVEGYECEALKAADQMLKHPTDWCIELHGDDVLKKFGSSNSEIVHKFLGKEFRVYIIHGPKDPIEVNSVLSVPESRCHLVALRSD